MPGSSLKILFLLMIDLLKHVSPQFSAIATFLKISGTGHNFGQHLSPKNIFHIFSPRSCICHCLLQKWFHRLVANIKEQKQT